MCIIIWQANGENNANEWLKAFPATLWSIVIDGYTDLEVGKKATWKYLHIAFEEEFKCLRNDDEIVTEIYNTRKK